MTETQFVQALTDVSKSYTWKVDSSGTITGVAKNGTARGQTFNPIQALARTKRTVTGFSPVSTRRAASSLGLSGQTAASLTTTSNRGHGQVLRGRIRGALGL